MNSAFNHFCKRSNVDPQLVVWRVALTIVCLLAIGAIIILTYESVSSALSNNISSASSKAIKVFGASSLGIIGTAIFVDGLFAALYWRWWLAGILRFIRYAFARSNNSFNPTALSVPFMIVYWFNSRCRYRRAAS